MIKDCGEKHTGKCSIQAATAVGGIGSVGHVGVKNMCALRACLTDVDRNRVLTALTVQCAYAVELTWRENSATELHKSGLRCYNRTATFLSSCY